MYLCGPGKHNCQPFCGPEGRFYCSDSVCSLWPAPFSYLCVSVMILGVYWKLSAAEQVKTGCCHTPAVVSTLLTPLPVSWPLTTPHHYMYNLLHFRNAKLLTYRDAHSSTYFRLRLCLLPLFEGFLQTVQAIRGSVIVLRTAKIHTNQTLTERITWQHGRYLWNATNKIQAPNYCVLRR